MSDLSKIADEVFWQKYKYWLKTLSQEAIDSNFFTFADLFDRIRFLGDIYISDTVFSSLLSMILFGIPLSEIVPLSLVWSVELPTIDEFVLGTLIKLVREDITVEFPELSSIFFSYFGIFEPEHAETLWSQRLEKGVYGRSRYGYSYYDPVAMEMFLKSVLFAVTKKDFTDSKKIAEVKSLARALELNEDVVRYVFNSLQLTTYSRSSACFADYCWLDFTALPEERSQAVVPIIDLDARPLELETESIADSYGGCWADNCILDFSYLMPETAPTRFDHGLAGNLLTSLADYIAFNFNRRITTTALALGNYQRADERAEFKGTGRVDSYAMPRVATEVTRSMVLRLVERYETRAFVQNLYVSAALNLIKTLTKPGGWGDEAQKLMTRDEILTYFVEKWASRGLKREILEKVFSLVYDSNYISILAKRRLEESESLKVSRGGLPS